MIALEFSNSVSGDLEREKKFSAQRALENYRN